MPEEGERMPDQKTVIVPVEDYTQRAIGITMEKGVTVECPHCKRVGVAQHRDGETFYLHKLEHKLVANQDLPEIIYDTCSTNA
jgi:hypothetical protein